MHIPAEFPTTSEHAKKLIEQSVSVTSEMVEMAKAIVRHAVISAAASNAAVNSEILVDRVRRDCGVPTPPALRLGKTLNSATEIRAAAEWIAWRVAAAEAIVSLVATRRLAAVGEEVWLTIPAVQCHAGLGGAYRRDLEFPDHSRRVPASVRLGSSRAGQGGPKS
jgi:hypothetical protein